LKPIPVILLETSIKATSEGFSATALEPKRIRPADRVIQAISIKICIPTSEKDGILGGPSASIRVVVTEAEADEVGVTK